MGKMSKLSDKTFYKDRETGMLYFYEAPRLELCPSGVRLKPSHKIPFGLSSRHDDKVEIDNLEEVDPLKYIEEKRKDFNDVIQFVKERLPQLQEEPSSNLELKIDVGSIEDGEAEHK